MATPYASALLSMLNGEIDTDSSNLRWTHHTSTHTPNRLTHQYVSSLTNELSTAAGYTAGGAAAAGTRTLTVANSWGTSRTNSTAYTVGTVVRPATGNTFLYKCVVAGTSAASPPTFPTVIGTTVTEASSTLVWECVGSAIVVFSTAAPVWATATFTGVRYSVLSQRDAGASSAQPLICYLDWTTDRAGLGGNFTINPPAQGLLHWFLP